MGGVQWSLVLLVGCALESLFTEGDAVKDDSGQSAVTTDVGTDVPSETSSTVDTGEPPTAEYYSFEVLFVADELGGWEDGSTVEVELHDEVLGGVDDTRVLCTLDVPFVAAPSTTTDAKAPVWAWWDVGLTGVPDAPGCPEWAAAQWRLGIGDYDVRLDPAVYAAQLDEAELFGVYLQETPDGPVYVVGVAGTAEMFAGSLGLAQPPLIPGVSYIARSLILLRH